MKAGTKRALRFACYAIFCSLAFAGDDDAPQPADASANTAGNPALNAEQQRAVNLQVAHPVAATAPERTSALGVVLDGTSLESDESERAVAEAQQQAVSAEASRLRGLYKAGAGTSLKMLETAQAEEAKARAEVNLATVRFAQHWGPLATESPALRQKRLDAVTSGRSLLVRADLPGRHIVGALPVRAMLDVDGIEVPGRVLGPLAQFSDSQSAVWLPGRAYRCGCTAANARGCCCRAMRSFTTRMVRTSTSRWPRSPAPTKRRATRP
jgi:hypothetical protein